jgi:hypothetical protein
MVTASKLPKWLGFTQQQQEIIEAISTLQQKSSKASPNLILMEHASITGAPKMQKSNFFTQLKLLRGKGYVKKAGEASYQVDFEAIKNALQHVQAAMSKETEELKKAKAMVEQRSLLSPTEHAQSVRFFEYEELYYKLAEIAETADRCQLTGVFPRILYAHSPSLMYTPGAQRFAQALWSRCIMDKKLALEYLTTFNIPYLFNNLYSVYKEPTPAYEEIRVLLNNLETLLQQNEKLNLRYSEGSYGLDIDLPYRGKLEEVFILVRDEKRKGIGTIYIRSPELAIRFKELFEEKWERAVDMKGPKADGVYKKLERDLELTYSKYHLKK